MKPIVFGGISTLLLAGIGTPAALAQPTGNMTCPTGPGAQHRGTPMMQRGTPLMHNVRDTEAFNLVSLAYRGEFEDQGIPSYQQLVMEYTAGDLSAEDVIEAGVEDRYLSPAALEDQDYINAVDLQLSAFGIDDA